nr:hypothetical protein [Tanacetum cinerariifolium]
SIMYAVRCTRPDVAFMQDITSRCQQNSVIAMLDSKPIEMTRNLKLVIAMLDSKPIEMTRNLKLEAEYIAASEAVVWIRKFIDKLGVVTSNDYPIKMNFDNSAAIIMAKESGIHKGARHFKRKYHYVRECIETSEIDIVKIHTDDNLADPFTKALVGPNLTRHARSMGLHPASSFIDLFADTGFDSDVGWSFSVGSVPVKNGEVVKDLSKG